MAKHGVKGCPAHAPGDKEDGGEISEARRQAVGTLHADNQVPRRNDARLRRGTEQVKARGKVWEQELTRGQRHKRTAKSQGDTTPA